MAGAAAPLLQDVSLRLPANSLGLVYGRSGAGKTTLLNLVAGLARPSAGNICIAKEAGVMAAGVRRPGPPVVCGSGLWAGFCLVPSDT